MNFYAVYIISSDGRIMVGDLSHQKNTLPQEILAAGILEEINRISDDLRYTSNTIDCQLDMEGITYYAKRFGDITVGMASDIINELEQMVQILGWRFLRKYGDMDLLNWGGKTELFDDFTQIIQEVVTSFLEQDLIYENQNTKPLTAVAIFDLPNELQNTAISLLSFEHATVIEIAEDVQLSPEITSEHLTRLEKLGYVTCKKSKKGDIFTISKSM